MASVPPLSTDRRSGGLAESLTFREFLSPWLFPILSPPKAFWRPPVEVSLLEDEDFLFLLGLGKRNPVFPLVELSLFLLGLGKRNPVLSPVEISLFLLGLGKRNPVLSPVELSLFLLGLGKRNPVLP